MRAAAPALLSHFALCGIPNLIFNALPAGAHPLSGVLSSDPALNRLLGSIFGNADSPLLPGLHATPLPADSATPRPVVGAADQTSPQPPAPTGIWTSPAQYSDLTSFGVRKLAYGSDNMAFVTGSLPITAPVRHLVDGLLNLGSNLLDGGLSSNLSPELDSSWPAPNASTTLMQLKFPAGSINPGTNRDLRGGAGFYALPVQLAGVLPMAKSVSLAYSVYFPPDFDWVKGGKLAGLYGGHETCSGGNDAMKCFSTRLMWRAGGEGELYLYAPKDSQSPAVCSTPPFSLCDTSFGMSIGRGSFRFASGGWTRVKQTVTLNTPGTADGTFVLEVNGGTALSVNGIYYRHAASSDAGVVSASSPVVAGVGSQEPLSQEDGVDGGHDGMHEDVLDRRQVTSPFSASASISLPEVPAATMSAITPKWTPPIVVFDDPSRDPSRAIGFSGIFFSTFFGGHDPEYATPRDQYIYFGDFELSVNG